MKIALIGHSHVVALRDALGPWRRESGESLREGFSPAFKGFHEDAIHGVHELGDRTVNGTTFDLTAAITRRRKSAHWIDEPTKQLHLNPWLRGIYEQLSDFPVIVSAMGGDELWGYMYQDIWKNYQVAGCDEYRRGLPTVDSGVIRITADYRVWLAIGPFMLTLNAFCPRARLILVAPPPPLSNPASTRYTEGTPQISSLSSNVRLFWHSSQVASLQQRFGSQALVVTAPPEALDQGGFLRPDFSEGLTHANAEYGRLIWARILWGI